jgi:hypothetical protein
MRLRHERNTADEQNRRESDFPVADYHYLPPTDLVPWLDLLFKLLILEAANYRCREALSNKNRRGFKHVRFPGSGRLAGNEQSIDK